MRPIAKLENEGREEKGRRRTRSETRYEYYLTTARLSPLTPNETERRAIKTMVDFNAIEHKDAQQTWSRL